MFTKTLSNKDKIISDLKYQIEKARGRHEEAQQLRMAAGNDLREKEEANTKMKERLETLRRLAEAKSQNFDKLDEIEALKQ